MTQIDGKIYHAHGLEELILSKCLYYLRQYTDSMQSHQITKDIFHRTRTKYFKVCLEAQNTQNSQRHPEKEKWSWKNQYYQSEHTTQGNLQIQCNPYQITKDIFHRTQTKYFKLFGSTKDPE